jgi:hypothetical protein
MKSIIEFLYSVVKNYVTKKAKDGDRYFVEKCNNAFETIDGIWLVIKYNSKYFETK